MQYLNFQIFYKFLERHKTIKQQVLAKKQVSRNIFLRRAAFCINMQKLKHVRKQKGIYNLTLNRSFEK